MFKDLFQLYQIGKDLGLTKKEINGSLFIREETHSLKNRIIFYIILLIIMTSIGFLFFFLSAYPHTDNIYGSGARYSTIRISDFKKKLKVPILKK
ncbi:MAG: hypothetical protein KAX18_11500 [Candidatus Lokiarchaeota archaeon]|nr:hypothetical protein [Candidatus Lokiarchaeota archaeon]